MKIPKKIVLACREYTITLDPKTGGGCFDCQKRTIVIGTLYKKDILRVLTHEVIEVILTERSLRYGYCEGNDGLLFSFNHQQYEDACTDIAYALHQLGLDK